MPKLRGGGSPAVSLLTFKIKSTNATGLNANTIRIEIDMNSFAVSSLQESSWATINLISEAGWASQVFNVGDEKTVLINNEVPYTFVILGFDHDDLTAGGTAGITFGMKNLLADTYNMNSSKTNFGGWHSSVMRTSSMAIFFTQLPTDLQSAIKNVNKLATAGGGWYNTSIQESKDKLFLFSAREIAGTAGTGYVDEGTQYAYWVGKGASDRKLGLSNGSGDTYNWWLRSPYIDNNSNFRYFSSDGDINTSWASYAYGVSFGFCV